MKRRWGRIALIVAAALIVLAVAVMIVGKYVIVPSIIRRAASAAVRERWDGDLEIGGVEFNWTGPISLERISLRDAKGRPWANVGSVELTMRNWPSTHPVLTDVSVSDVELQALFAKGRLDLPLKPAPPASAPSGGTSYVDLQSFTIHNLSFALMPESEKNVLWGGFQLELRRKGQGYALAMERKTQDPSEKFTLTGNYTGQPALDYVSLSVKHTVTPAEAATLVAALVVPGVAQANGKIDADVQLKGPLEHPAACQWNGRITLSDWTLSAVRGPLMTGVKADMNIKNESGAPTAHGDIVADVCEGRTEIKIDANVTPAGSIKYHVETTGKGISFDALVKSFAADSEKRTGKLKFRYVVEGDTAANELPSGQGRVALANANLTNVPILTQLLGMIGLSDINPLKDSGVEADFAIKGQTMTLNQAGLANDALAVDVEPGGTVNFATHQLDLYVLAVPVKRLHDFVASIPFVKSVVDLGDKLARLHIKGNWNDPPASLITKEPLTDLTEGAKDFFKGIASQAGSVGAGVLGRIGELIGE